MTVRQPSLFDRPPSTLVRASDPLPSHLAAAEVARTGVRAAQADAVLTAVRRYPGRTSRELAVLMGADRHMVARRTSELAPALIRKGEPRECAEGRRLALTWWAV